MYSIWWPNHIVPAYGSRSCWAPIKTSSQKPQWIKIVIIAIEKGSLRCSIDPLAIERYWEAVEIAKKTVFQRREKHGHECNQACYSTKDPNNFLSSQKNLSTRKMSSI